MSRFLPLLLSIVLCFTFAAHAAPLFERNQDRDLYSSHAYSRALNSLVNLSRRNNKGVAILAERHTTWINFSLAEFVGWHGTNIVRGRHGLSYLHGKPI